MKRLNFEDTMLMFQENAKLLRDGKWGVERESQRTNIAGKLALTPHPMGFGDKVINQEITTDFAESQLEFITPAFSKIEKVYDHLSHLYEEAIHEMGGELLWPFSMPPHLPSEADIPIARFDDSEAGRQMYRYRQGLANRYGKKMQMISGVHFNFSFGEQLIAKLHESWNPSMKLVEFQNQVYFATARNFLRYRWLLIYLFGASPSFDRTYLSVVRKELDKVTECCPECIMSEASKYSTSYRVSRFGYANEGQKTNGIRFNSKKEYIQGIEKMMKKKSKKYANIQEQLNDRVLQKESEFYSSIRVKQITNPGETQMEALRDRGVKYAEVRILDVNPFSREGFGLDQMRFMQVFMLYCLLKDSRKIRKKEMPRFTKNHNRVALLGRKPGLWLYHPHKGKVLLREWGIEIFRELKVVGECMDLGKSETTYQKVIKEQEKKLFDLSLLPSSQMEQERTEKNDTFLSYGVRKGMEYKEQGGK